MFSAFHHLPSRMGTLHRGGGEEADHFDRILEVPVLKQIMFYMYDMSIRHVRNGHKYYALYIIIIIR